MKVLLAMRKMAADMGDKSHVAYLDGKIHAQQKLQSRPSREVTTLLRERVLERRQAEAELRRQFEEERRKRQTLQRQEKKAKLVLEAAKASDKVAALASAKAGLEKVQAEKAALKKKQEDMKQEGRLVRSYFADKLRSRLLRWITTANEQAETKTRLRSAVRAAVKDRRGHRSVALLDFMEAHRHNLVAINPHGNKKDVKAFASTAFAYEFLQHRKPEEVPAWDIAPACRLEGLLNACCPHYMDVCGSRFSGQQLLNEAQHFVDLAFLSGVFRYSKAIGSEAFPHGLHEWPCKQAWWLSFVASPTASPSALPSPAGPASAGSASAGSASSSAAAPPAASSGGSASSSAAAPAAASSEGSASSSAAAPPAASSTSSAAPASCLRDWSDVP